MKSMYVIEEATKYKRKHICKNWNLKNQPVIERMRETQTVFTVLSVTQKESLPIFKRRKET